MMMQGDKLGVKVPAGDDCYRDIDNY